MKSFIYANKCRASPTICITLCRCHGWHKNDYRSPLYWRELEPYRGTRYIKKKTPFPYRENEKKYRSNSVIVEALSGINIKCCKMTQQSITWHVAEWYTTEAAWKRTFRCIMRELLRNHIHGWLEFRFTELANCSASIAILMSVLRICYTTKLQS